ncbi:MAG TPA: molecular chaperone TorD family protein [Thermoleophilaceae bacterium]|nr:molecular chaperone TorD family protein [Thermoleophilaceae bacterium]
MELLRALAVMCEPPADGHARLAAALDLPAAPTAAEHTGVFVLELPPYASIHLGPEGMLGGEAGDRIAGFWRALGLVPPAEPDHLAALLGLYAGLAEDEAVQAAPARRAMRRQARAALLHEHLLSWLDPWLAKLAQVGPPVYAAWGELLATVLRSEAEALLSGTEPLPAHLAAAPALEPPSVTGGGAFLDALLAPARSGLVLVREDLARAAPELGLALRVAERRFVLRNLLAQDAMATLAWLEGESRRAAERPALAAPPVVERFWQERARATAEVLADAAAATHEREVSHVG